MKAFPIIPGKNIGQGKRKNDSTYTSDEFDKNDKNIYIIQTLPHVRPILTISTRRILIMRMNIN